MSKARFGPDGMTVAELRAWLVTRKNLAAKYGASDGSVWEIDQQLIPCLPALLGAVEGGDKGNTCLSGRVSPQSELLLALAARCEREGPSRALDAAIAVACRVGSSKIDKDHWIYRNFPNWIANENGRVEAQAGGVWWASQAFTTSLDAAVTLVPKDWGYYLTWMPEQEPRFGKASCFAMSPLTAKTGDSWDVRGKTSTLALCAAALRARAAVAKQAEAPDKRPEGTSNPSPKGKEDDACLATLGGNTRPDGAQ